MEGRRGGGEEGRGEEERREEGRRGGGEGGGEEGDARSRCLCTYTCKKYLSAPNLLYRYTGHCNTNWCP